MPGRAIEVQGLIREFKKGPRAVDGIDLHVEDGEIYGFLGPNGAGKSTTVKMLVTLLPPSGGRATVGGFDVARQGAEVRRVIGVALQDAAVDPLLTGREHVRLQAGLHGFSRAESQARGEELLERVGLSGAGDRKIGTFSGGMRRRLDLALSLVHRPSIVFLDEPTTGLDIQSRTALWEEVNRLAKDEGVTIFLTTQYLEEADVLADRVGIIDHGHIVAEGTPAALKAEVGRATVEVVPEREEDRARAEGALGQFGDIVAGAGNAVAVRFRDRSANLVDVVRALDSAGIAIADLELHAPTLDDVFLEKTGRKLEGIGADEEPEPPAAEPEADLEAAVGGRSRIERVPTEMLKVWMAERRAHQIEGEMASPSWTLLMREGPLAGQRLRVVGPIVIGREGVDVVISDPEISRRHTAIRLIEGAVVIEDLHSLNGTWVNGRRIDTLTLLAPGDLITVGKTVIEVRPDASS